MIERRGFLPQPWGVPVNNYRGMANMAKARISLGLCVCILLVACADHAVEEPTHTPLPADTAVVKTGPTEALLSSTTSASPTATDVPPDPTATEAPSPTASQTPGVTVEDTEAYKQLPEISLSIESALLASPDDPTAYLPTDPIPARGRVRLVGTDQDGAWLLVLHNHTLGWIPAFYSSTRDSTVKPDVVVEQSLDECSGYLGGMIRPDQVWGSSASGSVVVQGLIYRPQPEERSEEASLAIEMIEGHGEVVAPETTLAPVAGSNQVYAFSLAIENLEAESRIRIRIRLMGIEHEPLAFQAAFFSTSCSDDVAAGETEIQPFMGEVETGGSGVVSTPVVIKIVLGPKGTATPVPPPTKKPTPPPFASSVSDFTSSQGANGWKYLFEEGRNSGRWRDMQFGEYNGNPCWLTGTWESDVRICHYGQVHPGHSTRIAYEWRPSQARDVRIKVHAHKVDTKCGDGVSVETYRAIDGQGMVERLGSFRIGRKDSSGKTQNYRTHVAPGTLIYVIVDIYGNSQCDATKLLVEIY